MSLPFKIQDVEKSFMDLLTVVSAGIHHETKQSFAIVETEQKSALQRGSTQINIQSQIRLSGYCTKLSSEETDVLRLVTNCRSLLRACEKASYHYHVMSARNAPCTGTESEAKTSRSTLDNATNKNVGVTGLLTDNEASK